MTRQLRRPESSTPPAWSRILPVLDEAPPRCPLGKRHRDTFFVHIQADVDWLRCLHDPSPMRGLGASIQATIVNMHRLGDG